MDYEFLKRKPFDLDDSQIAWVDETIKGMSFDDKIGQLFLLHSMGNISAEEQVAKLDAAGVK
ncbi:MAG: hypothetical protein J1E06_05625, partial [Acutalibacter sp.]|nr:hypothetical protein [Acutalibacter sp.]